MVRLGSPPCSAASVRACEGESAGKPCCAGRFEKGQSARGVHDRIETRAVAPPLSSTSSRLAAGPAGPACAASAFASASRARVHVALLCRVARKPFEPRRSNAWQTMRRRKPSEPAPTAHGVSGVAAPSRRQTRARLHFSARVACVRHSSAAPRRASRHGAARHCLTCRVVWLPAPTSAKRYKTARRRGGYTRLVVRSGRGAAQCPRTSVLWRSPARAAIRPPLRQLTQVQALVRGTAALRTADSTPAAGDGTQAGTSKRGRVSLRASIWPSDHSAPRAQSWVSDGTQYDPHWARSHLLTAYER